MSQEVGATESRDSGLHSLKVLGKMLASAAPKSLTRSSPKIAPLKTVHSQVVLLVSRPLGSFLCRPVWRLLEHPHDTTFVFPQMSNSREWARWKLQHLLWPNLGNHTVSIVNHTIVNSAIGYPGQSALLTEGGAYTEHEDHRQGSWGAVLEAGCHPSHRHCSDTYHHHSSFLVPEKYLYAGHFPGCCGFNSKNKDRQHPCPYDLPFQWIKTSKTNVLIYLWIPVDRDKQKSTFVLFVLARAIENDADLHGVVRESLW